MFYTQSTGLIISGQTCLDLTFQRNHNEEYTSVQSELKEEIQTEKKQNKKQKVTSHLIILEECGVV